MGAFSYKCFLKIKLRGAFRMKKTLKKISAASLVVILSITLVACGSGNKTAATSESEVAVESTVEMGEEVSEETHEVVEEDGPTVAELLSTYNGPGDLAGSSFEAAIHARGLGDIIRSVSTKDVISVKTEDRSIKGQDIMFEIRVIDERMTLRFDYGISDEYFLGAFLETYTLDVGKVNVTPGSFDVIDQKKEEIGEFLDYWMYIVDDNLRPGKMRGGMSPFARVFEHDSSSVSAHARLLLAYKDLVGRLYDDGARYPTVYTEDNIVTMWTDYGTLTFDKHHRTVANSQGQIIATGATLENEPRKEFNAIPFDDDAQVEIVVDAIKNLYPQAEPLF